MLDRTLWLILLTNVFSVKVEKDTGRCCGGLALTVCMSFFTATQEVRS